MPDERHGGQEIAAFVAATKARSWQRLTGWSAIASGVIGIIAVTSLMAFFAVETPQVRSTGNPTVSSPLGTTSDIALMLQALLMLPVAVALHARGRQRSPGLSRVALGLGVATLSTMVILQLLLVVKVLRFAQEGPPFTAAIGVLGLWLIVVNGSSSGALPRRITRTGSVAGIGFAVLAASFFAFGGPAAAADPVGFSNPALLIGSGIGTLVGFIAYPIWAILLGRTLLRSGGS